MRIVNDIKDGVLRYYTMVRRKPLPENIQLIKFPVDIRRVYWEKSVKENFAVNSYVLPEFTGRYQLQAGQWADDYLKESSKPGFSLYKYIVEDAFNTASWLNTLKVPEETSLFIDN